MDIAKYKMLKNFTILDKVLLFLIKLNTGTVVDTLAQKSYRTEKDCYF